MRVAACFLALTGFAASHAAWLGQARADAPPDLVVPAGGSAFQLEGSALYGKVTIDGAVTVKPYDPTDKSSGWVWLRAAEITVSATGAILATGSGYRGLLAGAEGYMLGAGAGALPGSNDPQPTPGGGGAHIGKGAQGRIFFNCLPVSTAFGGGSYDNVMDPFALLGAPQDGMGSAGGASHAGNPNADKDLQGGNGGGVIILEAAKISVLGQLRADGANSPVTYGASPGGGAGGTVIITANAFSSDASTEITATGGAGGTGTSIGGGGGGGLVLLRVKDAPPATSVSVAGGATASMCKQAAGAIGAYLQVDPAGCVDADRDNHPSAACAGGDDCDDANAAIHPGVSERCDGRDNDCNGTVDDGGNALCKTGETCQGAKGCVPEPPTLAAPTGEGDPHIELGGGLCAMRGGPRTPARGGLAWALASGLALSFALRRARRSR